MTCGVGKKPGISDDRMVYGVAETSRFAKGTTKADVREGGAYGYCVTFTWCSRTFNFRLWVLCAASSCRLWLEGFWFRHATLLYFFPELQGQGKFRWILFDIDCAIGSVVLQDRGLEGRMQILLYNIFSTLVLFAVIKQVRM
jgi:hypothetical protein